MNLLRCYGYAAAAAKSLQSCPTLCDPIDSSSPGSPVPGILQARTLEWAATSFSNAWKWKVKAKSLNRVRLLATPWNAAHRALPSMGFSRQEYWSEVPLPSPAMDMQNQIFSILLSFLLPQFLFFSSIICLKNNFIVSYCSSPVTISLYHDYQQLSWLTQPSAGATWGDGPILLFYWGVTDIGISFRCTTWCFAAWIYHNKISTIRS